MKKYVFFLLCGWLLAAPVAAWNAEGHRTVALIAQGQLSPEALKYFQTILKSHPYPSVRDLVEASDWPDRVRSDPKYHHGTWHYVNIPIFLDGKAKKVPPHGDVATALNQNTAELKNENATTEERAVALAWVIHLIGDIHQPLHAATSYSQNFPKGDRGGTRFFVEFEGKKTSLHGFWDSAGGLLGNKRRGDQLGQTVSEMSERLGPDDPRVTKVLSPADWIQESARLARDVAYQGIRLNSPLSDQYVSKAQSVSQDRLVLAGYRLGAYLQRVYEIHQKATQ